MAIRILSNSIKIGDYTLSETSTGISFDGISRVGSTIIGDESFQGVNYGYVSGGNAGGGGTTTDISRFSFTSNGNGTSISKQDVPIMCCVCVIPLSEPIKRSQSLTAAS